MTNPYIAQDVLDQAAEAHRAGIPLTVIAGRLHCDVEHLMNLLGLPQWKQPQPDSVSDR